MKRKPLFIVLVLEAAALFALALLADNFPNLFSSLFAFPFEQIGIGLRALSLSGQTGNGLALALWIGISMLPLLSAWKHKKDPERTWENAALYALTGLLLFVLYGMTNPATICARFPDMGERALPVMKGIMGCTVWSVAVLWAVLVVNRLFYQGDTKTLLRYMRTLLYALCVLFTAAIPVYCGRDLFSSLGTIQKSADGIMAVVRFSVSALPYGLDIAITVSALALLEELLSDRPAEAQTAADNLSKPCRLSLVLVTASVAVFNILQVALAKKLSNVDTILSIPLMSLVFVLATLLFSRLIADSKRLHDEYDLFV